MSALTLLLLLSVAPTDAALLQLTRTRFERAARQTPTVDAALTRAARTLARRALEVGVHEAGSLVQVTEAMSTAGAWDASPVVVLARAPMGALLPTLAKQLSIDARATDMGAAVVQGAGAHAAAAVVLAQRHVHLSPSVRRYIAPPKGTQRLCGRLASPLTAAQFFVTHPSGAVHAVPVVPANGALCARLRFAEYGRYTVEVLATGRRGPFVAALFFVDVGPLRAAAPGAPQEVQDSRQARASLVTRINALRRRMGLTSLSVHKRLEATAQAWAERLVKEGFFSHVAPNGADLESRLAAKGYRFTAAAENLAVAEGPLEAHFGIEYSPAHRKNLLEPTHRVLGIGIARRGDGHSVLVEVFASPLAPAPAPAPAPADSARHAVYAAIAALRTRTGLKPLQQSVALAQIAQQHAQAAFKAQAPRAKLPEGHHVYRRALALFETVAVDVFVSDTPHGHIQSKNATAALYTHMGAGLVQGVFHRAAAMRYWVVVVYAARP